MPTSVKLSVLSLPATLAHGADTIHPVLLHDEENALLVDAGLPGMAEQFRAAMEDAGPPRPPHPRRADAQRPGPCGGPGRAA